jgi:ferrous iron transport protein A
MFSERTALDDTSGTGEGGSPTSSLDRVRQHCTVRVVSVAGPRRPTQTLMQLGIRPGEILRVRRSAPLGGPVLVEGPNGTVAIGRGMARRVTVRVLP